MTVVYKSGPTPCHIFLRPPPKNKSSYSSCRLFLERIHEASSVGLSSKFFALLTEENLNNLLKGRVAFLQTSFSLKGYQSNYKFCTRPKHSVERNNWKKKLFSPTL